MVKIAPLALVFVVGLILAITFEPVDGRGRGGGGRGGGGRSGGRSGGWFGSSSRSSGSSWFGGSSKKTKSSTYPKQQWGTSGGSYPKQKYGGTAVGGGGFVNPKSYGGYGSRSSSFGRSTGFAPTYSYRSPGYGTSFGTRFPGGVGAYGGPGFSKKRLGLGVGAGFLGGAMTGMAVMSVYHRYVMYKHMMMMHHGYGDPYYNNYYRRGECYQGCPYNAHCEYGFCECDYGFTKRYGQCYRQNQIPPPRNLETPFIPCGDASECQNIDLNLVCKEDKAQCACRDNFKWNFDTNQCEFYMDVDCSNVTYNSEPSQTIMVAANQTMEQMELPENKELAKKDNLTSDEVMQTSMLSNIDAEKASETDITEAFCRDVDSFSWEFGEYKEPNEGISFSSLIMPIIFVIVIMACCFSRKSKKIKEMCNRGRRSSNSNDNDDKNTANFSAIPMSDQPAGSNLIANPGFQPQATPVHNLPYSVNPPAAAIDPSADPAPIPPTQPGYTNVYPPLTVNMPPEGGESCQPASVYPPTGAQPPYPPATGAVAAPYPPAAYPLPAGTQAAPYPPAAGGPAALPYPLAPGSSGPAPAQAPVYPPYPNTAQPPFNPTA